MQNDIDKIQTGMDSILNQMQKQKSEIQYQGAANERVGDVDYNQ